MLFIYKTIKSKVVVLYETNNNMDMDMAWR